IAREELCKLLQGIDIFESRLRKYMKEKVRLSLKSLHTNTMQLDAARIIKPRFNIITEWKAVGMGFQKSCVFIGEAGFNSCQIRNRAWSVKCTLAIVKVPTYRGVSLCIFRCICPF
ncbi:hypothetical protein BD770DRAFT_294538, partial [Pilaira anomala]